MNSIKSVTVLTALNAIVFLAFSMSAQAANPKLLMIKPGPLQPSVGTYPMYGKGGSETIAQGGSETTDLSIIQEDINGGSLFDAEPTVKNAESVLQLTSGLTFRSVGRVRSHGDVSRAINYLDALINDYYFNGGVRSVELPAHSALIAPWMTANGGVQKRNPQWFGSDPIKFAIFNAGTTAANSIAPKFVDFITGSSNSIISANVKQFLIGGSPTPANLFFLSDTSTVAASSTAAFISVIGSGNMTQFSLPNSPPFDPCFGGATAAVKAAVANAAPLPVLLAYSLLGEDISPFVAAANTTCSTAGTSLFGAGAVIYAYAGLSDTGTGSPNVTFQLGLGTATLPSGEEAKYYVDPQVPNSLPSLNNYTSFQNNIVVSTAFLDLYKYLASPAHLHSIDNLYQEIRYDANGALFTGMVEHDLRFDTSNQLIQRSMSFSSVTGTTIHVTSFVVNGRWYNQNADPVLIP
jgi:hypothetical protein